MEFLDSALDDSNLLNENSWLVLFPQLFYGFSCRRCADLTQRQGLFNALSHQLGCGENNEKHGHLKCQGANGTTNADGGGVVTPVAFIRKPPSKSVFQQAVV